MNRPHSDEPTPTPIEKAARNRITTPLSAPSVDLAKDGSCDNETAPTSQNQDAPRIDNRTSRRSHAWRKIPAVAAARFQLTRRVGADAGAKGSRRLAANPKAAQPSSRTQHAAGPHAMATARPPAIVPRRIDRKVPASINALPSTSSAVARCCGMRAYLTGLENAA